MFQDYFAINILGKNKTAIIIYQMGKVGSTSIFESLKNYGLRVFKVHKLHPTKNFRFNPSINGLAIKPPSWFGENEHVYKSYISTKQQVKIICPIREPFSRNISAFFQNLEQFTKVKQSKTSLGTKELIEIFFKEYPHHVPLRWFEFEMGKMLNINVYDYPFSKQQGYIVIKKANIELLVIKSELSNETKSQVIGEFIGIDGFVLKNANVGRTKTYSKLYNDFKRQIVFDDTFIDMMLNSQYFEHFYHKKEAEKVLATLGQS